MFFYIYNHNLSVFTLKESYSFSRKGHLLVVSILYNIALAWIIRDEPQKSILQNIVAIPQMLHFDYNWSVEFSVVEEVSLEKLMFFLLLYFVKPACSL